MRNTKDKRVLTKRETKDYEVVYNKRVIVNNYYTLPYGFQCVQIIIIRIFKDFNICVIVNNTNSLDF